MTLTNGNARVAGILYFTIAVAGGFNFGYVHSGIFDAASAAQTAENTARNLSLFNLATLSGVVAFTCDVAVAVMFYYFFRNVHAGLSLIAAGFRIVQSAILAANTLNLTKVASLISLPGARSDTEIWALLRNHEYGFDVAMIFFGIHCVILSVLLLKSSQFANWISWGFMVAGIVYVVDAICSLMLLKLAEVTGIVVAVTAVFAEMALVLWLLLKKFKT